MTVPWLNIDEIQNSNRSTMPFIYKPSKLFVAIAQCKLIRTEKINQMNLFYTLTSLLAQNMSELDQLKEISFWLTFIPISRV